MPASLLAAFRACCVAKFVTVIWAPATTAPLASVTVPVISPNCCAQSRKTGSTMRRNTPSRCSICDLPQHVAPLTVHWLVQDCRFCTPCGDILHQLVTRIKLKRTKCGGKVISPPINRERWRIVPGRASPDVTYGGRPSYHCRQVNQLLDHAPQ